MNKREIMERVVWQAYEERLISAAKKINNGWTEKTIKDEIKAADKKLAADLEALNSILEES